MPAAFLLQTGRIEEEMNMKKLKIATFFLSLALACSTFTPAMAADKSAVSKDDKNLIKAEEIVLTANDKIEDFVAHAQKTTKDDVAKLLAQVEKFVDQTAKQVEKLGYGVECTYTAYVVDGQTVLIDPLRVVNRR